VFGVNFDVITIGSATIDVFATSESQVIKLVSSESEEDFVAFRSGDKVLISDLQFHSGGGGTNSAVSFSRLGLSTGFIGKIGSEATGDEIISELKEENISFLGTRTGKTGYSIVFDSVEKDRVILTYKGSNNDLHLQDTNLNNISTKWVYASSMINDSFLTLIDICSELKKTGAKIVFNPSIYQAKKGLIALTKMISLVDVLILNKEEAQALLGVKKPLIDIAYELSKSVLAKYVVVTDGSNGAVCVFEKEIHHITPSFNVTVVDTTGAGDAFASGFTAGLIKNYPVTEALILGMVQAEHVISAQGAKTNLLKKEASHKALPLFKGEITKIDTADLETSKKIKETIKIKEEEKKEKQEIKKTPAKNIENDKLDIKKNSQQENHLENNNYNKLEKKYQKTRVDPNNRVSEEECFVLCNGQRIYSINELKDNLRTMSIQTFFYHVHDEENHFSLWLSNVFSLPELAKLLSVEKTKIGMQRAIEDYFNESNNNE
jgi:ribokinase